MNDNIPFFSYSQTVNRLRNVTKFYDWRFYCEWCHREIADHEPCHFVFATKKDQVQVCHDCHIDKVGADRPEIQDSIRRLAEIRPALVEHSNTIPTLEELTTLLLQTSKYESKQDQAQAILALFDRERV